jgi:hypothetical protein
MSAQNDDGRFDAGPPILMSDNTPFEHQLELKPGRISPREHGGNRMTYETERLAACREIEAIKVSRPDVAAAIREGFFDTYDSVTRHFPAYDAGHAAGRAGGWLPIDTAPKAVEVLVAFTDETMGAQFVTTATQEEDRRWFNPNDGLLFPTRWQPLPAPPAIEGMGE